MLLFENTSTNRAKRNFFKIISRKPTFFQKMFLISLITHSISHTQYACLTSNLILMITDHGPKEKNQTFKFSLCGIKTKPIDFCIDIPKANSKPIESPFHQEFPQQGSSFLRTVRSAIILLRRVRYNKDCKIFFHHRYYGNACLCIHYSLELSNTI